MRYCLSLPLVRQTTPISFDRTSTVNPPFALAQGPRKTRIRPHHPLVPIFSASVTRQMQLICSLIPHGRNPWRRCFPPRIRQRLIPVMMCLHFLPICQSSTNLMAVAMLLACHPSLESARKDSEHLSQSHLSVAGGWTRPSQSSSAHQLHIQSSTFPGNAVILTRPIADSVSRKCGKIIRHFLATCSHFWLFILILFR